MNKELFYARLRARESGVFGTSLNQGQVDGIRSVLAACRGLDITFAAYMLATTYHETARSMQPVKETVMPHHKDKMPSDAEVIRRLEVAFKKGQLGNVKTPYWREGWFGRGYVQLTHKENYRKAAALVSADLIGNPDLAMRPDTAAKILVQGSLIGMFTGKKLRDYLPGDYLNARRVINRMDKASTIAGYAKSFEAALRAADWDGTPEPTQPPAAPSGGLWAAILRLFGIK